MTAKLSDDLVRELERAGDRPVPVEDPRTKRVYALVDLERYDVVRRPGPAPAADGWTESKNERRCALIRKKFSQGLDPAEARELADLQDELSAYRRRAVPQPYDVVDVLRAVLGPPAAPTS